MPRAKVGLAAAGIDEGRIAGWTVFRTDDPTAGFARVFEQLKSSPVPELEEPFAPKEVFEDYCVFESALPMPVFQSGDPPFANDGGGWVFDAGEPILQREEMARIVVTVPRRPMPPDGFPVVLFSRTGGGGDRPLVDRGVRADPGGPAIAPGGGPALQFARAGFAGVSVDGPHGGLRNTTGDDEQFLMFNVANPVAMRDNVRQSAAELALHLRVIEALRVPVSTCSDLEAPNDEASFDRNHVALMGHSMGATIAPLTFAFERRFDVLLLSGAGGSWIANVVHKKSPLPVRGFAELIIGVAGKYMLHEHDPLLSLLQWAGEPADPPIYARVAELGAEPARHVLMMQGIVDTYILPPIANTTSLSLRLDLAGDPLDEGHPGLSEFDPLEALLPFSGRSRIGLPARGNVGGVSTAVVVQHPEDGVEDGHEVVFQTQGPKHQYRCFLETWVRDGVPTVPVAGSEAQPCEL